MSFCECGCGGETNIARKNHTRSGAVKGQPNRYLAGHKGRQSDTYFGIHKWLRSKHPKSGMCEQCGREQFTEYALIHGMEHGHDRERYRELCRNCHRRYDLSILHWDELNSIRERVTVGELPKDIAAGYGVSPAAVYTVLRIER